MLDALTAQDRRGLRRIGVGRAGPP